MEGIDCHLRCERLQEGAIGVVLDNHARAGGAPVGQLVEHRIDGQLIAGDEMRMIGQDDHARGPVDVDASLCQFGQEGIEIGLESSRGWVIETGDGNLGRRFHLARTPA